MPVDNNEHLRIDDVNCMTQQCVSLSKMTLYLVNNINS